MSVDAKKPQQVYREFGVSGVPSKVDAIAIALADTRTHAWQLRKQNSATEQAFSDLKALALELCRAHDIPDANCACHLSAPCNDCRDYGELRELVRAVNDAAIPKVTS